MYRYLFLLFFLVPLLEVWILVRVGSLVGAPWLIASIIATAAIGVFFLRAQGLATLVRAQRALAGGELPTLALFEGALLLVAGALLLTPGFATDAVGFVLLWPTGRRGIARAVLARYGVVAPRREAPDPQASPRTRDGNHARSGQPHTAHRAAPRRGEVIEGEYTRDD